MSYWVYLRDDAGNLVEVPRHAEGGTVAVAGTPTAELNVTYNYSRYYKRTFSYILFLEGREVSDAGIRWLDGKPAGETTSVLEQAVSILGTDQSDDYWEATEGNAGHALSILLDWATQHPEATFEVSG
jgi:hypothetical protein